MTHTIVEMSDMTCSFADVTFGLGVCFGSGFNKFVEPTQLWHMVLTGRLYLEVTDSWFEINESHLAGLLRLCHERPDVQGTLERPDMLTGQSS